MKKVYTNPSIEETEIMMEDVTMVSGNVFGADESHDKQLDFGEWMK